jgi:hypothetical protein
LNASHELINGKQQSLDNIIASDIEKKKVRHKSKEYKIIYSVSDVRDLIKDTICSIKTLNKYIDKEDIIIFYTPPRSMRGYDRLSKLGTVIKEDNLTDEISLRKGLGRYGDKFHALFVDSPNVIFLDSDTIINGDISRHLEGDYEVSGRIAPNFNNLNMNVWNLMFFELGKTPIPMINTGYLIFQDHTHNKIADKVVEYMYADLPRPDPNSNQKDQYALSLAVSDKKIKWMNQTIHSFIWKNEFKGDVVHGSVPRIGSDLKILYNRMKLRTKKILIRN